MDVTFENGPAFTVAVAKMADGEQIRCEGGAMLSMSDRHPDRDVHAGRHPQGAQALALG